jgi:hypothetical protein
MPTTPIHDYYNISREVRDFRIFDEKGRRCGVVITQWPCHLVEQADGYLDLPPGNYLRVNVTAARNGEGFGASQNSPIYRTRAEVDAYVARRVRDTENNYRRKYGSY